jgi:hypothetical protein
MIEEQEKGPTMSTREQREALRELSMHLRIAADLAKQSNHIILHDRLMGEKHDIDAEVASMRTRDGEDRTS